MNVPMLRVSTVESVQMESIHTHAHVSQDMKVNDDSIRVPLAPPVSSLPTKRLIKQ